MSAVGAEDAPRHRAGAWELAIMVACGVMWPLAPRWPIGASLGGCLFGIAFGYLRARARPRPIPLALVGGAAALATMTAALALAARAPAWVPWAGWIGALLGLVAGWIEREAGRPRTVP